MNRRRALGQLGLFAGSSILLTFCGSEVKDRVSETELILSTDTQQMLDRIVNVIIPETDTPGARSLNIGVFVIRMVNDCYSVEDREKFLTGMASIKKYVRSKYGKGFGELSNAQVEELLNEADKKGGSSDTDPGYLRFAYSMIKRHTIQGYLQSEHVMTEILPYTMIPGKFQGCVVVEAGNIQTVIS